MLPIFTVLIAFGAFRYVTSATTYDRVLGAVLMVVAIGLGVLSYLMVTTRWEIYRDGVVQHRMGKVTKLRFDELVGYSYLELKGGLNAPDAWLMGFAGPRGAKISIRVQPDLLREKELPKLNKQLVQKLTERFRGQLASGVPWGDATLRESGLEVNGRVLPYGSLELRTRERQRGAELFEEMEIVADEQAVAALRPGSLNYEIGLCLVDELGARRRVAMGSGG